MNDPSEVVLEPATSTDANLLSNLLELYAHDLSGIFELEQGADGRFGYQRLPLYWSDPEHRFAFLICRGTAVVGFVLITRGLPPSEDPGHYDIAEFFVTRRHRRGGVGRRAAFRLWDMFGAHWTVRVSAAHESGLVFWTRVIGEYTDGNLTQTTRPGSLHPWRVFGFDSRTRQDGAKL